jgi:hypothetical protein
MNATIRFNLNNPEDKMAHMRCIKSMDLALALFKIQEMAMEYEYINIVQLNDIFEQHNITLNEIIS